MKGVTWSILLSFQASSVTIIVQLEWSPVVNVLNVIVLLPETAFKVVEEQSQLYVIVHGSVELNV